VIKLDYGADKIFIITVKSVQSELSLGQMLRWVNGG